MEDVYSFSLYGGNILFTSLATKSVYPQFYNWFILRKIFFLNCLTDIFPILPSHLQKLVLSTNSIFFFIINIEKEFLSLQSS